MSHFYSIAFAPGRSIPPRSRKIDALQSYRKFGKMSSHIISSKGVVAKRTANFTGEVWAELLHGSEDVNLLNVTFMPCARTHWHTHEKGQILQVLYGSGFVCDKGEEPRSIKAGDLIYASAGTTHWHGASEGSILTHLAIGLGKTEWLEAVTDAEYPKKGSATVL